MVEDKRQRFWHSARLNDEEKSMDFYEENEDDRTPVALSREPSDVKTQFTSKCGWHSDNLPSPTVRRGESMMTTAKYAAGVDEDTLKASQQARNDAAKASGDYGIIRRSRLKYVYCHCVLRILKLIENLAIMRASNAKHLSSKTARKHPWMAAALMVVLQLHGRRRQLP
jgi:hypothetical protein